MTALPTITPDRRNFKLPEALRGIEGWLVWRFESAGEGTKPLKVPYYVNDRKRAGKQGSNDDRSKLAPYGAALRRMIDRNYDGIGLAMLADWGLTAIDIDNCVGPNGELPEIVQHLVARTYVEYSPSNKGVRAFLRGNLGNHKSPTKGNEYGLETFYSTGYVTITGRVLPDCVLIGTDEKIGEVDDYIRELCEQRFGALTRADVDPNDPFLGLEPRHNMTVEAMEALLAKLDPDMGRDTWIRVGMALHHETMGDDTGFYVWNDWSANGSKYVGEDDLRTQWTSFDRREGSGRQVVTMSTVKALAKEALPDAAKLAEALKDVPAPDHAVVATPEAFDGKFRVTSAGAMTRRPPQQWVIKGVLPKADVAALFGEPGSGKSFLLLDMLCAIARGIDWCGMPVVKGRVVIIAAEGAGGYGARIKAYCALYGLDPDELDLGVIAARPNLMDSEDVGELAKSIKAAGGASVIAIDTLAQVTPGANENSGEDMGLAISNSRVLREVTGAMIVLAHHSGKDASKGLRGWSGLNGAVDAALFCWREEDRNYRELRITKQKDGEDGKRWGFKLNVVEVGRDADGDAITSCVVAFTETAKAPQASGPDGRIKRLGKYQKHILELVATLEPSVINMPLPKLIAWVHETAPEEWRDERLPQNVVRAVKGLARDMAAEIGLQGNLVLFYG